MSDVIPPPPARASLPVRDLPVPLARQTGTQTGADGPKLDLLADLLKIFTIEQLEMFLDDCEQMCVHGYGGVLVTFENHHPQNSEQRRSRQFPKPNNYKPE